LKTIEKALMVFKCFAQAESSLGTTELANRLNTNVPTMSRVLSTLKRHGFLEQDPTTRRYRLGPAMVEMAQAVYRSLDGAVTHVAAPFANALRDQVGERVHLEVLSGNNIYLAYVAETPKPISLNIGAGDQVMPHAHAGAKAIIAFSPAGCDGLLAGLRIFLNTRKTRSPTLMNCESIGRFGRPESRTILAGISKK
jgi:IclR family acetate operon transcriptional repressor